MQVTLRRRPPVRAGLGRANNTLVGTLMGGTSIASLWAQSPVLVAVLQVPRVEWVKHFPLGMKYRHRKSKQGHLMASMLQN